MALKKKKLREVIRWLTLVGYVSLAGCATVKNDYTWNRNYNSVSQSERIRYIILHYTQEAEPGSLKILTQGQVSSHYLIGQVDKRGRPTLYQLVPESKAAWHAGISFWEKRVNLNDTSIGIEIVNEGCQEEKVQGELSRIGACKAFEPEQMQALSSLLKSLMKRYHVPPENVIGHGDIAPERKIDPGPAFPWKQLADQGLTIWPKEERVQFFLGTKDPKSLIPVGQLQTYLKAYGYKDIPQTGILDVKTQQNIREFQMHFRNADISGQPDAETLAIVQALVEQKGISVPFSSFPVQGGELDKATLKHVK